MDIDTHPNPPKGREFREGKESPTSPYVLLHSPMHIISAIELPPFGRAGVGSFREGKESPTSPYVLLHSPMHIISAVALPPFGRAGVGSPLLGRICNPTTPSISIFNALKTSFPGLEILIFNAVGLQIRPSGERELLLLLMFYCTVPCTSSAPLSSLPSGGLGWVSPTSLYALWVQR